MRSQAAAVNCFQQFHKDALQLQIRYVQLHQLKDETTWFSRLRF